MREALVPVTFLPAGKTVQTPVGTTLIEIAAQADISIDSPCGGEGICGKCRVIIQSQPDTASSIEENFLSADEISQGYRLACQTRVFAPMTVCVPDDSSPNSNLKILVDTEKKVIEKVSEPGISTEDKYAVAIDIGTTTLAAVLLDCGKNTDMATASALNPQVRYGDDVLSRILFAGDNAAGLQTLHESIIRAVNDLITELCNQSGINRGSISSICLAGNTTMQHFLCRMDTNSLATVPFTPASNFGLSLSTEELGIKINRHGTAYIFPIIGGFVGGDTVSGILATDLTDSPGPTLFVDIGTNGEIVLWANGKLTAASTAAGPAFEGARISCGMRGCDGAIEKIAVDGDLKLSVIGNKQPSGICGSGLIDIAAELLSYNILTPQGRLQTPDQLPDVFMPDLQKRIVLDEGKVAFMLASESESATGRPIVLTQRDFRELQLAAGAIRAGIIILLNRAGLNPEDLRDVFLAGGFGNFIRRSNAQRIGLLPSHIEHDKIHFRGNTSLSGARLAALSAIARSKALEIAKKTEHVELAADRNFQNVFADSMIFPDGN